jgi:hypothetical protein
MVVIFLPSTLPTVVMHDLWDLPSRCTVHEPQSPTAHPNVVPVSLKCSLITHNNGISGLTSTSYFFPLIPTGNHCTPPLVDDEMDRLDLTFLAAFSRIYRFLMQRLGKTCAYFSLENSIT